MSSVNLYLYPEVQLAEIKPKVSRFTLDYKGFHNSYLLPPYILLRSFDKFLLGPELKCTAQRGTGRTIHFYSSDGLHSNLSQHHHHQIQFPIMAFISWYRGKSETCLTKLPLKWGGGTIENNFTKAWKINCFWGEKWFKKILLTIYG